MTEKTYNDYLSILREELIVAMGCTEPIAIAYAAAKASEVLGIEPTKIKVFCSGNIIKNVKAVTVPNTGGLVGIEASAVVGAIAGNANKELEVIAVVEDLKLKKAIELLNMDYCEVSLLDTDSNLHIIIEVINGENSALVEIKDTHNNISRIEKNGVVILKQKEDSNKYLGTMTDRSILSVKDIYEFANTINIEDVRELLDGQITKNIDVSNEGLKGEFGLGIGKVILESFNNDTNIKIKAHTAAASEARMCGSPMPVVTNSGSGNQGITVSVPVVIYAKENNIDQEKLYRGLIISNLLAIHFKTLIGRLSAFCGVVTAACASGAAITYLNDGTLEQIENTITNTMGNTSGIICDGAKATCAAKIASSLDAALMGHHLAMKEQVYLDGTGIIKGDIESTIKAVGKLAKDGMKETDQVILNIMLDKSQC